MLRDVWRFKTCGGGRILSLFGSGNEFVWSRGGEGEREVGVRGGEGPPVVGMMSRPVRLSFSISRCWSRGESVGLDICAMVLVDSRCRDGKEVGRNRNRRALVLTSSDPPLPSSAIR